MKKLAGFSFIFVFCILLAACSGENKNTTTNNITGSNIIEIYYPEGNEVISSKQKYQLKQPDSITGAVEELMVESLKVFEGDVLSYSYMLDETDTVTLQLVMSSEYTKEYGVLTMASLSSTLFQVEAIDGIKIILLNEAGQELDAKLILRNTFYFYGYEGMNNSVNITIYTPDSSGDKLVASTKSAELGENVSCVEYIINTLVDLGVISSETVINAASINGGICYLDLSSEFEDNLGEVRSECVLYSVVNSITSLSYISSVQIIIDGNIKEEYRGTVDISSPLGFNNNLVATE